jgi:hypothetical protein
VLVHVIQRLVFYFNLVSFFEFLKQVPKHKIYIRDQLFTRKKPGPIIKLLVFLKKIPTQISESDNILCLGNIFRLKYVLAENTLSFSDLALRYLINLRIVLILKNHLTEELKSPSQTNDCFPEFLKKE